MNENRLRLAAALCVLVGCGGGDDDVGADARINVVDAAPRFDSAPRVDALPDLTCDTVTQDCPTETPKCTLIDDGTGALEQECITAEGAGDKGRMELCTRTSDMPAGYGRDDCMPGFWCSGVGITPPMLDGSRVCRAYCHNDTDCMMGAPNNERCLGLTEFLNPGPDGYCITNCTLFTAAIPDPNFPSKQLTCAALAIDIDGTYAFAYYRPLGVAAAGAACAFENPCIADHDCLDLTNDSMDNPKCIQLCDSTHPCTSPETCDDQPDIPEGGGICTP